MSSSRFCSDITTSLCGRWWRRDTLGMLGTGMLGTGMLGTGIDIEHHKIYHSVG